MYSKMRQQARAKELQNEIEGLQTAYKSGKIDTGRYKGQLERINREFDDMKAERDLHAKAIQFGAAGDATMGASGLPHHAAAIGDAGGWGGFGSPSAVEGAESLGQRMRIVPVSPMDASPKQWGELIEAAKHRTPYSVEVKPKSWQQAMQTKTYTPVLESGITASFTGNLPPVQSLYALGLPYESTRIADLLPGANMPGPSATWATHTANTAEVAVVSEGGVKGDIGPSITESQVTPVKIAGLTTFSLETWQDTLGYGEGEMARFLPQELTRSLINTESNLILNANTEGGPTATFDGIMAISGVQTVDAETAGSGSTSVKPLDAVNLGITALRANSPFADADVILVHPSTLSALRRQADASGRYQLDLLAGPLNLSAYGEPRTVAPAGEPNPFSVIPQGSNIFAGSLWGVPLVATTQLAAGNAVVMSIKAGAGIYWLRLGLRIEFNWQGDTLWQENLYSFRAEQRFAYSCPRPDAICVVSNLPTS